MERGRVARSLHPRQPVPRVGRQEPRQVLGFDYRRAVGQRTAQVLTQACAHIACEGPRPLQLGVKLLLRLRKSEGLQLHGVALGVLSHQHEVAGVGDQHEPVDGPSSGSPGRWRPSARRRLRRASPPRRRARGPVRFGLPLLHLSLGVEAEVRVARALLGKLAYAEHLGPERAADGVQQVGQSRVVRPLSRRAA